MTINAMNQINQLFEPASRRLEALADKAREVLADINAMNEDLRMCNACNGSGETRDGSSNCSVCMGFGEIKGEK